MTENPSLASLFDQFVGQEQIKQKLLARMNEGVRTVRILPHMLFCAPPKSGKETLALLVARSLGVAFQIGNGKSMRNARDMVPFLTNAEEGSVFLINDIDQVSESTCEFLVPAMDEFRIDITLGVGADARTINMPLRRFTVIGTTSKPSRISRLLAPWFAVHDFTSYSKEEFFRIVRTMALQSGFSLPAETVALLVPCCDDSLQNAFVLIKKIRGYLGGQKPGPLEPDRAKQILHWLGYEDRQATSVSLAARLNSMSGPEFEEFVARVFRGHGYAIEFTPASGDHGIDLMMRKNDQLTVVQCKRWDGTVGEPTVREFYGAMMNSGAEHGWVVTTAMFTPQAAAFVKNKPIRLIDADELLNLARSGLSFSDPRSAMLF